MRIAVIAAQGRSGQAFVHEALAAGHTIRAGIRGDSPFASHDKLVTVQCDATDINQVTELIDRCDAVVSLLGHVKGSSDFVQTQATETIVTAMEVAGIKRFVTLTGVGVWVEGDRFKAVIKLLNAISAKLGVKRFEDGIEHVKVLHGSNLDWTVLRALLLSDGEPGVFGLKRHGFAKLPTPRREIARAILEILDEGSFIRQHPVITRKKR